MANNNKVGIQEGFKFHEISKKKKGLNGKEENGYLTLKNPAFKIMIMSRYVPLSMY